MRQECLDHFLILGEGHLRHVTRVFLAHYNEDQPHQGVGNVPLPTAAAPEPKEPAPATPPFPAGKVRCRERLGGLIKHYYRGAA